MEGQKTINVSRKHFSSRVILFVLALAAAAGGIGYGIYAMVKSNPGLYKIEAKVEKGLPYSSGISLHLNLKGSSGEIKTKKALASDILSTSLKETYMLYDEVGTYETSPSIGAINAAPGEWVYVGPTLKKTLLDAYSKTKEEKNYSLFASFAYRFWESQFQFPVDDARENDPLKSAASAKILAKAASFIENYEEHFLLEFREDDYAKLTVSKEYESFLDEAKVDIPFISLNALETAYRVDALKEAIKDKGMDEGYILGDDGSLLYLGIENGEMGVPMFDYDNAAIRLGTTILKKPFSAIVRTAFSALDYAYSPGYAIKDGDKVILRSLNLSLDSCLPNSTFASYSLYDFSSPSMVELAYKANEVASASSLAEAKALHEPMEVVLQNNAEKAIYASQEVSDSITLFTSLSYSVKPL